MVPSQWIQRTRSHIVVAINARVNIFGFPNSRGLDEEGENVNVGLLDQRSAVEWIRDNIRAFGGDPSKMVLWGQSSGSASTDYCNYAYPDDPVVHGFIQHSGSVFATDAELPLLFGTFQQYGGPATSLQYATASNWQDLYVAFARDPVGALPAAGWPAWTPDGSVLMWNPKDKEGKTVAVSQLVDASQLIAPCDEITWSIQTP